ncbi:MAG: phosphoribosylformylglycinamidine synthase subunit PurS [Chloroflexota bacterium]
MWLAKVYVTLKPLVNDPQGITIQGALHNLGFDSVKSVRAGKYFEVKVDAGSKEEAERATAQMCDKLLANPVIEDFRYEVAPL